jgi:hypothetical protein
MYGYEIKKSLSEFNKRINGGELSNNTLYPLLSKFEKNGITTKQTVAQEGKPNRIQYAMTEAGRIFFYRSLNEITRQTVLSREEFIMKLSFYPVLTQANRKKLLDGREAYLKDSIYRGEESFVAPEELTVFFDMEAQVNALLPFFNRLEEGELAIIDFYRKKIEDPCKIPGDILPLID